MFLVPVYVINWEHAISLVEHVSEKQRRCALIPKRWISFLQTYRNFSFLLGLLECTEFWSYCVVLQEANIQFDFLALGDSHMGMLCTDKYPLGIHIIHKTLQCTLKKYIPNCYIMLSMVRSKWIRSQCLKMERKDKWMIAKKQPRSDYCVTKNHSIMLSEKLIDS